jgi:hypothetical protein
MKPVPTIRQPTRPVAAALLRQPVDQKPTRIISPWRKVWARPRNAIAAMHQDTKSSAAGMFRADRAASRQQHHLDEDRNHERAGQVARVEVEPIEKNPHDSPSPSVIPGRPEGPRPESITTAAELWIPGSPLRGAPE